MAGKPSRARDIAVLTACYRETIYITNSTGDLLAVFPKTPSQNSWQHTIAAVTKRLERARVRCGKKQDEEHRRGGYSTLTDGSSFGGGQTVSREGRYGVPMLALTRVTALRGPGS